jgi:hypothetical protein
MNFVYTNAYMELSRAFQSEGTRQFDSGINELSICSNLAGRIQIVTSLWRIGDARTLPLLPHRTDKVELYTLRQTRHEERAEIVCLGPFLWSFRPEWTSALAESSRHARLAVVGYEAIA